MHKKLSAYDRVMKVAVRLFVAHGFQDVSIAEIAAASHCSSSTIYDMFESKENLFIIALERGHATWYFPELDMSRGDECAFRSMLKYSVLVVENLCSAFALDLLRASVANSERTHSFIRKLYNERNQMENLSKAVEAAMNAGFLKLGPARSVAYCINAGICYEPTVLGLQRLGSIPPAALAFTVLEPFLTTAGEEEFHAWLDEDGPEHLHDLDDGPWIYFSTLKSKG